jgi:hypothetical protein
MRTRQNVTYYIQEIGSNIGTHQNPDEKGIFGAFTRRPRFS